MRPPAPHHFSSALRIVLIAFLAGVCHCAVAQDAGQERAVADLIHRGADYDKTGDTTQSRLALTRALDIAKQSGMAVCEGDVYTAQAVAIYDDPRISWNDKAGYYRRAAAAYVRGNDWEKAAGAEAEVAKALENGGRTDAAVAHLEASVPLLLQHKATSVATIYGYLGMLHMKLGDQAKSIHYGNLAVETAERDGQRGRVMSDIYNNIAASYYGLMHFDSAYTYLRKAITEAERAGDTASIFDNYFNLVTILPDLNRQRETLPLLDLLAKTYPVNDPQSRFKLYYLYTNSYLESGQPRKAGNSFRKLQELEPALTASPELYGRFLAIAIRYHIATQQFSQARIYLEKRDTLLEANYSLREHCNNERYWFIVDSTTGNHPGAIRHYQKYAQLMDSIFSIEKTAQLQELQIAYQTEAKDRNIDLLRQSAVLKDATIRKQAIIRNLSVVGVLLLLAVFIIGFSRYRLKQRVNRKLELKQEEINEQNDVLKALLKDKEWLLKEIHHRVKNNLQIVISLLNTQSAYLDNEQGLMAINDSQHRMQAMSLIHQKLYQSDDMGMIDMDWYIPTLTTHMQESYGTGARIRFRLDLQHIELDVAQAVPAGLILNEAISNAIKYAFPENRGGTVVIVLRKTDGDTCELRISDDGIGLPEELDVETCNSLGMSLMMGLSAQLGGEFSIESREGTRITITFSIQRDHAAA